MTKEYTEALAKAKAASAKFAQAQQAYRSRKIGDAEFLAARAEYDLSDKEFDAAYAKEQLMGDSDDHSNDDLNLPHTY